MSLCLNAKCPDSHQDTVVTGSGSQGAHIHWLGYERTRKGHEGPDGCSCGVIPVSSINGQESIFRGKSFRLSKLTYGLPVIRAAFQKSTRGTLGQLHNLACLWADLRLHGNCTWCRLITIFGKIRLQAEKHCQRSIFCDLVEAQTGKHTTSKITRIIKLQLGQTAISSPSRKSSIAISNLSPQGHG